jgi:hypothetical protein
MPSPVICWRCSAKNHRPASPHPPSAARGTTITPSTEAFLRSDSASTSCMKRPAWGERDSDQARSPCWITVTLASLGTQSPRAAATAVGNGEASCSATQSPASRRVVSSSPEGRATTWVARSRKRALRERGWRVDDPVYWRPDRRASLRLMSPGDVAGLETSFGLHRQVNHQRADA